MSGSRSGRGFGASPRSAGSDTASLLAQAERAYRSANFPEAERLCRKISNAKPLDPGSRHLSGLIAIAKGDLKEAEARLKLALRFAPQAAEIWNSLGNVQEARSCAAEAVESFDRALQLNEGVAEFHANRANALRVLGRLQEALDGGTRALGINRHHAASVATRGNILLDLGRYDEALVCYEEALRLRPGNAGFHKNRGSALRELGRLDEAFESFASATTIDPSYADAQFAQALALLRAGRFRDGWEKYEWRWKTADFERARSFSEPLWDGTQDIAGRTILIYSEQGLGDTIQFSRYVSMAKAAGADVLFEVPELLEDLLAPFAAVARILRRGEVLPKFDLQCPLLSLPKAFATDAASIPENGPYLSADAELVSHWERRLPQRTGLRIGLVSSGNAVHTNDRNRSVPLDKLRPIFSSGHQFFSLQREVRPADRQALASLPAILDLGDELRRFTDTAALLHAMDVLISVDTSVAHLAGALGRPVWILLPFVPDWRWQLDRRDSPWYPTARLYRQSAPGQWDNLVSQVARDLSCARR